MWPSFSCRDVSWLMPRFPPPILYFGIVNISSSASLAIPDHLPRADARSREPTGVDEQPRLADAYTNTRAASFDVSTGGISRRLSNDVIAISVDGILFTLNLLRPCTGQNAFRGPSQVLSAELRAQVSPGGRGLAESGSAGRERPCPVDSRP